MWFAPRPAGRATSAILPTSSPRRGSGRTRPSTRRRSSHRLRSRCHRAKNGRAAKWSTAVGGGRRNCSQVLERLFKAQGLTQRQMVEELNRFQVSAARGGEWSPMQLQRVLKRLATWRRCRRDPIAATSRPIDYTAGLRDRQLGRASATQITFAAELPQDRVGEGSQGQFQYEDTMSGRRRVSMGPKFATPS
jgi:hypothetical protein